MSLKLSEMSCVQWFEDIEKHKCGYCNQENTSISNGMWAYSLTAEDYQNLIDRGWRRSGKYCYKPMMEETCCPQYTIKCDVTKFSLSKSQKKVMKIFNKFIETGVLNKKEIPSTEHDEGSPQIFVRENPNTNNVDLSAIDIRNEEKLVENAEPGSSKSEVSGYTEGTSGVCIEKKNSKTSSTEPIGVDRSKPPCKKAKLIRLERKREKLSKKGLNLEEKRESDQKSIEQFIEEMKSNDDHRFELRLVPTSVPNTLWNESEQEEYLVYKRYQMAIHNDPPSKLKLSGFQQFLVHSPIKPEKFPDDIDGPGYGSFHQQYRVNGVLVAVGVVDILPRCVSSVYFFYDPDYRSLTLGTYGSLREVYFTRSLHEKLPALDSYYMGYYIHSCPKMRYKGKLSPSYLLCPETYRWLPIERCLSLLDKTKYSRLNQDEESEDKDCPSHRDIARMKIVCDRTFMTFENYQRVYEGSSDFGKVARLIGKRCCGSLVFLEN